MIIQRVAKLTLHISPKVLIPTIKAYTDAVNYASQIGYPLPKLDANIVHKLTYSTMRKTLPAQLSIAAKDKAVESLKSVRELQKKENKRAKKNSREPKNFRCPHSKQSCIRYDARSYNIWFDRGQLSLLTVEGRIKVSFTVPDYFKQYLCWKRCSADLVIRGKNVFLHVVFQKDIGSPEGTGEVIGIDRGINNPAVLSTGDFYGGKYAQVVKKRYQRLRKELQSKGHSGKRHLAKIKGKENRFGRDVNHCISKQIVSTLKAGDVLVLENLTNIRDSKTKEKEKAKPIRKAVNSWSFYQLEMFLGYKAVLKGVSLEFVNPCYTSQECSKCGHISESNRVTQSLFRCEVCGYTVHADLNASRVIRKRYIEARSLQVCHSQAKGYVSGVCQDASCSLDSL